MEEPDNRIEYVYVMGARSGPVKIGYTRDPGKRLQAIRSGWVPDAVERDELEVAYLVEGSRELERTIHVHFGQQRVTGEWFNLGPTAAAVMHVADVVRRHAATRGLPAAPAVDLPRPAEQPPPRKRVEPGPDAPPRFATVATQHREYFQAWVAAGFTETQAIQLVAALVARDGA